MDTTNKYVEMCRAAEEIQKLWKPQAGDFLFNPKFTGGLEVGVGVLKNVRTFKPSHLIGYAHEEKYRRVWLPRQDQLQRIVERVPLSLLNRDFYGWQVDTLIFNHEIETMEQLWLAFVMDKKFKKIWKERQWILQK